MDKHFYSRISKISVIVLKILLVLWIFSWGAWYIFQNRALLKVYPSLFLPWNAHFDYMPWLQMLQAVAAMALYWWIGRLFLNCFDLFIPRSAMAALAFTAGCGIVILPGELAGFFTLFTGWLLVPFYIILIISLLIASSRHWRKPFPESSGVADNRFARQAGISHAREVYAKTIIRPRGTLSRIAELLLMIGTGLLLFLNFYHGLFYPVIYWDSLSYLGMARMLVLDHHFPVKIMAQMGIGTGSNYPQMYRLLSAIPSSITGWSQLYARMLSPLCGLFSALLVYHTVLRLTRIKTTALAVMLIFAGIPYAIRYFSLTSDYSLAVLYTAAFLYCVLLYMDTGLKSYLTISGVIAALACHINYLTPLLFIFWIVMIIMQHPLFRETFEEDDEEFGETLDEKITELKEPPYTRSNIIHSLKSLVKSRYFVRLFLILIIIISPWYIRNTVLTGNPVYPYFSGIFGGKRINPEMIESMQGEWLENGDGISKAAMSLVAKKISRGEIPDQDRSIWISREPDEKGRGVRFTLFAKIYSSFYYFVTSRWAWLLAPFFIALAIPGTAICLHSWLRFKFHNRERGRGVAVNQRFGIFCILLVTAFFGYHYIMAGYYLYQILPVIIPLAILSAFAVEQLNTGFLKNPFFFWCIAISVCLSLPFGMMNFKLTHQVEINGKPESPLQLSAFRRPGTPEEKFYSFVFGSEVNMFNFINSLHRNNTILTHDNRYLLYHPSIKIIHPDDWELHQAYDMQTLQKKAEVIRELGIDYYHRIPMEEKHGILKNLSLDEMIREGYFRKVFQTDGNILYETQFDRLR